MELQGHLIPMRVYFRVRLLPGGSVGGRGSYSTFEDYCKERWGWARNYSNKLIAAAEVVDRLGTIVPKLPVTESQARPLTILEPELQVEAWKRAVENAPGTGITARRGRNTIPGQVEKGSNRKNTYPGCKKSAKDA